MTGGALAIGLCSMYVHILLSVCTVRSQTIPYWNLPLNGYSADGGYTRKFLLGKEVSNLARIDDNDLNLARSHNLQQPEGVQQFTKLG